MTGFCHSTKWQGHSAAEGPFRHLCSLSRAVGPDSSGSPVFLHLVKRRNATSVAHGLRADQVANLVVPVILPVHPDLLRPWASRISVERPINTLCRVWLIQIPMHRLPIIWPAKGDKIQNEEEAPNPQNVKKPGAYGASGYFVIDRLAGIDCSSPRRRIEDDPSLRQEPASRRMPISCFSNPHSRVEVAASDR